MAAQLGVVVDGVGFVVGDHVDIVIEPKIMRIGVTEIVRSGRIKDLDEGIVTLDTSTVWNGHLEKVALNSIVDIRISSRDLQLEEEAIQILKDSTTKDVAGFIKQFKMVVDDGK